MPLIPGSNIGPYTIVGPLGAGGMGEVWHARDPRLNRDVAIKSLPEVFARDPERLARFEREAKLLASVNHSNIAGIHGLEQSDGHRYLILEFVAGETLESRLARGPMSFHDAVDVAAQMAQALEVAHESGIVHRDLKPGNVMITPDGVVKVLDFGLARGGSDPSGSPVNMSASPTLTHLATEAGMILGTAAYMSPEQARGRRVDRRTDIWSFGCVLFECLTGRQAFEGETVSDLIAKILEREPEWDALPADLPPRLRELLHRCLTKDASKRLRDIGEARILLADPRAVTATDSPRPAVQSSRSRGRQLIPWILAAAAVILALGLLLTQRSVPAEDPLLLSIVTPKGHRIDAGPEFNLLAISPDGRSVAYVARSKGLHHLYLRNLTERTITQLADTENARNPFFSPDGEWVAFTAGLELKKISVRGGTPVTLGPSGQDRGGAWSSDGSIVFSPNFGSPLIRIPETGGPAEAVTVLDSTRAERTHRWPSMLADTEWVLFTVGLMDSPGGYDDCDIEVVSLRTGERRKITTGSYARYASGGHLIVARSGSLYHAFLDARDPRPVGVLKPVLDGVLGQTTSGAVFMDVARNGTLAYLPGESRKSESRLAWMDLEGRSTDIPVEHRAYQQIEISPDGNRLLTTIGPGGGAGGDIWLIDLIDYTSSRLTFEGDNAEPVWTPDGLSFVWDARRQVSTQQVIMVQRVDGSDSAREITRFPELLNLNSLSPDGKWVLFTPYGAVDSDIRWVPLDGSREPEILVDGPGVQTRGIISPDQKWISYTSSESGQQEIYVKPMRAGNTRSQISRGGGIFQHWAPDGKSMFYLNRGAMYRVSLTVEGESMRSGTPEYLFDLEFNSDSSFRDATLHPSGTKFLVRLDATPTERREIAVTPGWTTTLVDP